MANTRQRDLKPDESSSSDEEEQVSESDLQPKTKNEPQKPLMAPSPSTTKPQPPVQPSSSETEEEESSSDSDSDSDSDSNVSPKKSGIEPVSSEAANVKSNSSKKSGEKATSVPPPPPAKSKRPPPAPAAAANEKEKERVSKKAKKADEKEKSATVTATDDDSSKDVKLYQRLWSEEDEIVILQGILDYKTEKNIQVSVSDMDAFHDFIKKSLNVQVITTQLVNKYRKLKSKYLSNFAKEKKNSKGGLIFSKIHDQKVYDLSKLIWGSSGTEKESKNNTQKNGSRKVTATVDLVKGNEVDEKEGLGVEKMDVSRFVEYGRMGYSPVMEDEIMKAGMELVEGSKREELKEKWNKLKLKELELYIEKMELIKEQAAVVFEAVKSSRN